ncbi:hypothetical protein D3C76_675970 [compost metagenome]
MVADIGPGAVGDGGGQPRLTQCQHHGLDGQGGEIGRRAIRHYGPVDGLSPGVIRDAGVIQIDGDPLQTEFAAPPRLTHRQHQHGLMLCQFGLQLRQGQVEDAAQSHRPDQMLFTEVLAIESPDRLPGRVERLATEGLETGQ